MRPANRRSKASRGQREIVPVAAVSQLPGTLAKLASGQSKRPAVVLPVGIGDNLHSDHRDAEVPNLPSTATMREATSHCICLLQSVESYRQRGASGWLVALSARH